MADDPINGSDGATDVASLGLDISPYIKELRRALKEYNEFAAKFSKTLQVRLDPTSMQGLSNAFGVQIRQALQVIKREQNETVEESVKAAKKITNAYGKAFGMMGFKELPKEARKAREEAEKEFNRLGAIAAKAGKAVADGIASGSDKAKASLASVARETNQVLQQTATAAADMSQKDFDRAQLKLQALQKMTLQKAAKYGLDADKLATHAQVPTEASDLTEKIGGKRVLSKDAERQAVLRLKSAVESLQAAQIGESNVVPRMTSQFESLGASLDRLRERYNKLTDAGKARFDQLVREREALVNREPLAEQAQVGGTPYSHFKKVEDLARFIPTEDDKGNESTRIIQSTRKMANINLALTDVERQLKQEAKAAEDAAKAAQKRAALEAKAAEAAAKAAAAQVVAKRLGDFGAGRASMLGRENAGYNQARIQMLQEQSLENQLAAGMKTRLTKAEQARPVGLVRYTPDGQRERYTGQPLPPAPNTKAYKEANKEADKLATTHKNMGANLLQTGQLLFKWIVFYRAIHDLARLVENSITGFVRAGVEYNRELEQQQLGLRGILAEAFTLRDATGQVVTGAAALNQLTLVSATQWRKIQAASLAVVGTTSDLMGLYSGILPFATKLGASLDDVLGLTKATAVAAGLLDISFQDARSALVSLLQGRALTRNRLVGSLGFTKDEVERLKGTPKLLELVRARMDAFALSADDAQRTLAATTESAKDFVGIVASGFTKPFTDTFKNIVNSLSDARSEFALFKKDARTGDFQPSDKLKAFISFTSAASKEILEPITKLGTNLAGQAQSELPKWVLGLKAIADGVVTVVTEVSKMTLAVTSFLATNRELIKWGLYLIGLVTSVQLLSKAIRGINDLSVVRLVSEFVTLASGLQAAYVKTGSLRGALKETGVTAKATGVAVNAIGNVALVGLLYALEQVIVKLARISQEAQSAKRRIASVTNADADIDQTILHAQDALGSERPKERTAGIKDIFRKANIARAALENQLGGGTNSLTPANVQEFGSKLAKEILDASNKKTDLSKQIADERIKYNKATGPEKELIGGKIDALAEQLHDNNSHLEELNKKGDVINNFKSTLVSVLGQLPAISEALDKNDAEAKTPKIAFKEGFRGGNLTPDEAKATLQTDQALRDTLNGFKAFLPVINTLGKDLEDALQPASMVPNQPEETGGGGVIEKPAYRGFAESRIAQLESDFELEKAVLERQVAERVKTQAEADQIIRDKEAELVQQKLELYKKDQENYVKYVNLRLTEKDKKGKTHPVPQAEVAQTLLEFATKTGKASNEQQIVTENQKRDEANARRAFSEGISEVQTDIAQRSAELYGTVEETALDKFDKHVKEIKKRLQDLKFSPEQQKQIDEQLAALSALRSDTARQSRAEGIIKSGDKLLTTTRDQEGLLLKQFELGEVGATEFLKRLERIREVQVQILSENAKAFDEQAAIKEAGLAKALVDASLTPKEGDAQHISDLVAEIERFKVQAAEARAQIDDILSVAARVQKALEAWTNAVSLVGEFLSAADGLNALPPWVDNTNTALESLIGTLNGVLGVMNQIVKSATAFSRIPAAFKQFNGYFKDVGGFKSSAAALGGLFTAPFKSGGGGTGPNGLNISSLPGQVDLGKQGLGSSVNGFSKALPLIGVGISSALAIGTAIFQRAVEKAKKDISKGFEKIGKGLQDGSVTLGKSIGEAEKERIRIIEKYSRSKSGRKALKELLPDIDNQIEEMRNNAKKVQDGFEESLKRLRLGTGVFADFAGQLLDLEKSVKEYLDSFDTSTRSGLEGYNKALETVKEYTDLFFKQAKLRFQEEMVGFEGEALAAQERVFALINEQDGYYVQLRDLAESRLELEEAIQDEQERRREAQDKLNDLAKKELEIRKRIAEIIRQAAEDEAGIRRRGVLEAQLSIAQQKAIEISNVRYKAQEEINKLKDELAGLQDDIKDETKQNARKDRDFAKQRRGLDEREIEIRKAMRLNEIRLSGARQVAAIEGQLFGMASDEFDLAEKQNVVAAKQAEIQVQRWRETAALIESIRETAEGVFFEPPPGFPQIRVQLGSITIDNTDNSSNVFNGGGTTTGPARRPPAIPRKTDPDTGVYTPEGNQGFDPDEARRGGFGEPPY